MLIKRNKKENILNKKRKGFTLIELVIVIAIIGVLLSIVVVKYNNAYENSKIKADYVTASNIANAVYMAEAEGDIDYEELNGENGIDSLVSKGYLNKKPESQSQKNQQFSLSITGEGVNKNIVVKLGDKTVYPKDEKK